MRIEKLVYKLITDKYAQQSAALRGWYVLFGGIFNVVYYFLFDQHSVKEPALNTEILFVRLLVFISFTLITLILFVIRRGSYTQLLLFVAGVLVGFGIIHLMQLNNSPDTFHNTYIAELILVICIGALVAELTPFLAVMQLICWLLLYNIYVVPKISANNVHFAYNGNLAIVISGFYVVLLRIYLQKLSASFKKAKLRTEQEKERLKRKNAELIESDAFKSKLIAVLSHDVRSPLMNIQSLLDLKNGLSTAAEKEYYDEKIRITVQYTYQLLNKILDWSATQLKGIEVNITNISLHELVEGVLKMFKNDADTKQLDLINEISPSVILRTDHSIIELLLRNLVSNAIKFTKHGYIMIDCYRMEDKFEISVTDTGVGINDDLVLFDKNNITSSSGTNNEKGSGFGLILCLDYAAKIGAKITYEKNITGGTTFTIQLPVKTLQSNKSSRTFFFSKQ